MLVLSAIYYMIPKVRGVETFQMGRGMWGYRQVILGRRSECQEYFGIEARE